MQRGALLVLGVAGCLSGGGHAGAPSVVETPTAPVKAAEVAAAPAKQEATRGALDAIEVTCARAVRCGTIGRSQLEECREGPGASRLTLVWGYEDKLGIPGLVAAGRLRRVPVDEQACVEFLARAPCAFDRAAAPKGCSGGATFRMLAPGVAVGGTCTRWEECIDGWCSAQAGCSGVCKALAKLGEACGQEQLCGEDAFCWEGTCRARADVGAACGGHWQWCRDGLHCAGYRPEVDNHHHPRPEVKGVCSAGKQLGEACEPPQTSSGEVCAAGLYCDWGSDAPVCRRPGAAGDECRWLEACGDGLQCAGLVLGGRHPTGKKYGVRAAGRCLAVLDAGDACDPAAFVSGCPASMVCDEQKKVCRSTGHAGDPCVSSWVTKPWTGDGPQRVDGCFSSHYCDAATRTCKPELAVGERCVPQAFGVEDEPCFLGKCDAKRRRCVDECQSGR